MVTTSSIVVVQAERPADVQTPWEKVLEQIQSHSTPADLDSLQFCFDSPRSHRSSEAAAFAQKCFSPGRPIVKSVMDLTSLVFEEFQYDPKATTVTTPVSEVLQQRRGVCQDFAHVQIAMLRSLGLAARYVSGYVRTYPKPGQPRLIGVDASHAWLSVYCGDVGWIDVDPTNNKLVGDEYITLGWGRDYGDVTPLKGVFTGGGKHSLDVSVDVAPLDE
jgi:transglutaminase-like putative cysteine protease